MTVRYFINNEGFMTTGMRAFVSGCFIGLATFLFHVFRSGEPTTAEVIGGMFMAFLSLAVMARKVDHNAAYCARNYLLHVRVGNIERFLMKTCGYSDPLHDYDFSEN